MVRAVTMMAALLALGWATLARTDPKPDMRFDSPERVAEIPFDLHNNHICIRGRLNDSDSLWFVLDTGAGDHTMNVSRARSLGLEMRSAGQALGVGGHVDRAAIEDVTVRLPGLTLEHQRLGAIPLDGVELQSGRPMDVILGFPLFRDCVVEVDYEARRLKIWDAARAPARSVGANLPIELVDHIPHVKAKVELPSRTPVEGRFVIDTGAATALLLSALFVEEQGVLKTAGPTIRVRLGGVGGPTENPLGRIERLHLGPYAIEKPVTVFRTARGGYISARGTAGNIGGEVMRRFRVTFDYKRKRMTLEPNGALEEPFEADMTGLLFLVDSTRALRVTAVQPGSPAAEAGIAGEDVIEEVDGRAVAEIGIQALRPMFRLPGRSFQLTVRRGGERRTVSLTTRRLI